MNENAGEKPSTSPTKKRARQLSAIIILTPLSLWLLLFLLGFFLIISQSAIARFQAFIAPKLEITSYVVLLPPQGETATASWNGGTAKLPLLFQISRKPCEGPYTLHVMESVAVVDSEGNLLTTRWISVGFDDRGGIEIIPPSSKIGRIFRSIPWPKTIPANHFWVYRYTLPDAPLPPCLASDRNLVKTEDALPMPEGFTRPLNGKNCFDDIIKQKVSGLGTSQ